jgi:hypothetical protein
MQAAVAARSRDEFADLTQRLVQSLRALVQGALGRAFDGRSTVRMDLDAAMPSPASRPKNRSAHETSWPPTDWPEKPSPI